MSRPHRATFALRSADLASDFGIEWATKLFGAKAIASLPVRTVGKNKGKPKGFVLWLKCDRAGYDSAAGHAFAVGSLRAAWIGAGAYSEAGNALIGVWLGKQQQMCSWSPQSHLFAEGRARAEADAQRERDWLTQQLREQRHDEGDFRTDEEVAARAQERAARWAEPC